jgi:DNA-binding GntR family transcriptional regulator
LPWRPARWRCDWAGRPVDLPRAEVFRGAKVGDRERELLRIIRENAALDRTRPLHRLECETTVRSESEPTSADSERAVSRGSRKTSLRQKVYEALRQEIRGGSILPGDLLRERELADVYGVSKTPVREALSLLEQENLVKAIPRAGYMVTQLTFRDLQEVHQLRVTLESMAARLAAENITEEELRELEGLIATSEPEEALVFNHKFHSAIARASGNSRLAKMIEQLLDDTDRWAALDVARLSPAVLLIGHRAELEALRTRDPDVAEKAMREHVQRVYDHLSALYP